MTERTVRWRTARWRRGAGFTALVVVLASCGGDSGDGLPVSSDHRSAVRITGVVTRDGSLCPVEQPSCTTPISLDTDDPGADEGDVVAAVGLFDGRSIELTAPLESVDPPLGGEPDFSSLCPELTNPAQIDILTFTEATNDVLGIGGDLRHDALATVWTDQASNVTTFWFARDLDRYRDDLLAVFGDVEVCLAAGADFSRSELIDADAALRALTERQDVTIQGGYHTDFRANRVVVPIEAVDPDVRSELDDLEAVDAVVFIELLDRPLSELPAWSIPDEGEVDILTARSRQLGGMAALGLFTLRYDEAENCLYWLDDGQRGTVVWPFGYRARIDGDVVVVDDGAGEPVARTGVAVEIGGGWVDSFSPESVIGDNVCRADHFFITANPPI